MKKELVVITKVDEYGVTYDTGIGASKSNFSNVKVGQEWEVVTAA